ncbi:hypothetical protein N0M98_01880 [Paenibacillus doosanensis]|nr:hypothetical protein [Paenibacillus doosanensis]
MNAQTHRDFPEAPEREEGTLTETAFDIVTLDEAGNLHFTRFGAGEDRLVMRPI